VVGWWSGGGDGGGGEAGEDEDKSKRKRKKKRQKRVAFRYLPLTCDASGVANFICTEANLPVFALLPLYSDDD
jgi:hypothetical protein